ncbi:MAG: TRAP transporter large permease [Rectinemataceae bacterium]|nr:TRAP transporter large permease [Rectinemataceae bacterium]
METVSVFLVLLIFILIDLPIVVAIGLTAVAFFVGQGQGQFLALLPQRMHAGTTGFTLLAVPFFILAGNLMNTGGVTNRIFRFAKAFVGHIPGGLGHVSVVAEMLFSGISGSAVADAAGLGQVSYKAMTDNGYSKSVAAAIVASSSTLGPIIPPSISFVLYGALTSVSVPRLFLAGFLPGALMGGAIMLAIGLMAKPRGFPRYPKADRREIWTAIKESFLSLMSIVIILGGIFSGIFTPTEAAVIACLYALFLGFLYKELKLKDLPEMFWVSIKQSVALLFIMAAANFFGWFLIYQRIPDNIIATLTGMSVTGPGVMAMFIVVIIILGLFMEGNAIFLITIPIFIPIAMQYGFDLVNFGVVMTLLIMIGNLTPPVGMCLYAVSSFTKISIGELSKECLPYLVGIFIVTVIIAYVPAISTCLPDLIMGVAK